MVQTEKERMADITHPEGINSSVTTPPSPGVRLTPKTADTSVSDRASSFKELRGEASQVIEASKQKALKGSSATFSAEDVAGQIQEMQERNRANYVFPQQDDVGKPSLTPEQGKLQEQMVNTLLQTPQETQEQLTEAIMAMGARQGQEVTPEHAQELAQTAVEAASGQDSNIHEEETVNQIAVAKEFPPGLSKEDLKKVVEDEIEDSEPIKNDGNQELGVILANIKKYKFGQPIVTAPQPPPLPTPTFTGILKRAFGLASKTLPAPRPAPPPPSYEPRNPEEIKAKEDLEDKARYRLGMSIIEKLIRNGKYMDTKDIFSNWVKYENMRNFFHEENFNADEVKIAESNGMYYASKGINMTKSSDWKNNPTPEDRRILELEKRSVARITVEIMEDIEDGDEYKAGAYWREESMVIPNRDDPAKDKTVYFPNGARDLAKRDALLAKGWLSRHEMLEKYLEKVFEGQVDKKAKTDAVTSVVERLFRITGQGSFYRGPISRKGQLIDLIVMKKVDDRFAAGESVAYHYVNESVWRTYQTEGFAGLMRQYPEARYWQNPWFYQLRKEAWQDPNVYFPDILKETALDKDPVTMLRKRMFLAIYLRHFNEGLLTELLVKLDTDFLSLAGLNGCRTLQELFKYHTKDKTLSLEDDTRASISTTSFALIMEYANKASSAIQALGNNPFPPARDPASPERYKSLVELFQAYHEYLREGEIKDRAFWGKADAAVEAFKFWQNEDPKSQRIKFYRQNMLKGSMFTEGTLANILTSMAGYFLEEPYLWVLSELGVRFNADELKKIKDGLGKSLGKMAERTFTIMVHQQ